MKHHTRLSVLTALFITLFGLAIIGVDISTLIFFHPAYAAPGITAEELDRYLGDKGSPLAGQGQALVESGRQWNVDPRLVVAIAGAESTFGTRVCAEYNAWNWFYKDTTNCSANAFSSWQEGIERVTRGLRQLYLDGGRTTIPKIAEIYTTTEREIWIRNVTQFYQFELGGDPNDLTFAEPSQLPSPAPAETSPFSMGTYLGTGEFGQEKRVADLLAEAGVRWAREEFPWAEIEPRPGQYRWRWEDRDYDAAVDALVARDIQVVGLLDYGPNRPPADLQDWLSSWRAFVREMVQHYRGRIRYWEIQNEENSRFFWGKVIYPGQDRPAEPDPALYARLLTTAYDEIKRADPDAKVILGGLAGITDDLRDRPQNYFHYLDQLHQAGAWDSFDILAVHPYREETNPEQPIERGNYDPARRTFDPNVPQRWNLVQELTALDRMASQFGHKPIWLTELGWSRTALQTRAEQRGTTPEVVQADYLVRTYIQTIALPNVEQLFWFRFRDRDSTFGIIDNNYHPKDAYRSYQKMTVLLVGSRFWKQVRGMDYTGAPGQDDVFEYRFQRGDQIIVVLWKATGGDTPRPVTVADIPAPTVRVIDPDVVPAGPDAGRLVQTTNGQITLQLTERPVYVVFNIGRVTQHTEALTTWPIAPYTFGVEGQGLIRLFVDGKLVLETGSDDAEVHRAQKTLWLRRGCHPVAAEYGQNYDPPRLGFSLWPSSPDFDAGLPPCEEAPPEEPANTPDAPVRAFFEAMDRLDIDAALESIAPVPGYRQVVGVLLQLYKGVMDGLNLDNDFSHLQYQVVSNDGRSARVLVWGPVIFRSTEDGSTASELEGVEVEIPVSNFLIRWYIYISPRNISPETSD